MMSDSATFPEYKSGQNQVQMTGKVICCQLSTLPRSTAQQNISKVLISRRVSEHQSFASVEIKHEESRTRCMHSEHE